MNHPGVSRLSDQFYREHSATTHSRWLLLDPILRALPDESPLGELLAEREFIRASMRGRLDSSLCPLLVPYSIERSSDFDLIHESLREALSELAPASLASGAGRRVCAWIESDSDGRVLARHIAAHALHFRKGRRHLLRWYDPAVFWAIWPLLSEEQQSRLLGPIKAIRVLDPTGRLTKRESISASTAQAGLDLSEIQWRKIDHITPLNAVLRHLLASAAEAAPIDRMRHTIMEAFARAKALGFSDAQDLQAFATHAAAIHPFFDAHPLIDSRLKHRRGDDYFCALVDDLTPEQWAMIRADLAQEHS